MKQDRFKRIEQKYLFPAGYTEVVRTWLEHACLPDPQYRSSTVSSIYFDTPQLFHFNESRNGEFLRAKVRLRWYADPTDSSHSVAPHAEVRCFLEVKTKEGGLSKKQRTEVMMPTRILRDDPFSHDQILDLPARVFELNYRTFRPLVPILMIRYQRKRYLDVASDSGIATDTEIRCTRANEAVVQGLLPVHLDVGVLEIKGMNRGINEVLNPIGAYLTKSAFSKYGITLESLLQPIGRRV
jgi:hypothetical protein